MEIDFDSLDCLPYQETPSATQLDLNPTDQKIHDIYLAMSKPSGGGRIEFERSWGDQSKDNGFEVRIRGDVEDKNGNHFDLEYHRKIEENGDKKEGLSAGFKKKNQ